MFDKMCSTQQNSQIYGHISVHGQRLDLVLYPTHPISTPSGGKRSKGEEYEFKGVT